MSRPLILAASVVVGACALGACGSGGGKATAGSTSSCGQASQGRVTVIAKDLAFTTSCLLSPAGALLDITFENQDTGVNHDLHLLGAPGNPQTLLRVGPATQRLTVELPLGTYQYVCDVHPTMVGELRVG